MMVVVILIGILTVMAMPTMAEAHFSARTLDDATKIAELYRSARTRALGRGAAMLVQGSSANAFNGFTATPTSASGGLGVFFLYEAQVAITGIAGSGLIPLPPGSPLSSCGAPTTVWTTIIGNASSSLMNEVNLNTTAEEQAQIWSVINDSTGPQTTTSLCYTPLGRAYYQPVSAPVFTPGAGLLHGELQIAVQRSGLGTANATGLTRTVIIPDSGATRIVSR